MSKKLIIGALAALIIFEASSVALASHEDRGTVIGAILGGVIGSNVGKGNGKTAAIIAGAIIGGAIGNGIGQDMDREDQEALRRAQDNCYRGQVGRSESWRGNRYQGEFITTREGYNVSTNEVCRQYTSTVRYNGRTETNSGYACSRSNGSYYEVQQTQVNWGGRGNGSYQGGGYGGGVNGGQQGGGYITPTNPPRYPDNGGYRPAPPRQDRSYSASVVVSNITRYSGGTWYRVNMGVPVRLDTVSVTALNGDVAIREAVVYTESGRRYSVYQLANGSMLYRGQTAYSESLRYTDRVVAVDLRMESFGSFNDVSVTVNSVDGYPSPYVTNY